MIRVFFLGLFIAFQMMTASLMAQTVIPNAGFENWTQYSNYANPTGWDTPNEELMAIPFFGFQVVTKSTDHQGTGSFSARLETKHLAIPPMDIPGFMTCGNLTVDITSGSYVLSGGVPVVDQPTHLKGYYKFSPKGGDSCVIGIGLWRTVNGVADTLGYGSFSTKDTVNDWTPFSAWIDYEQSYQPDSMNIIAMSTAQEVMTPGTVLFVDNLFLDYTVGMKDDPSTEKIMVYNDRETKRLIIFPKSNDQAEVNLNLFNMTGIKMKVFIDRSVNNRAVISYGNLEKGIYLLEVVQGGQKYVEKFFLNQ